MARKESYVERWTREQNEKAQKERKKSHKGEKTRGVQVDGTDTRSEGQTAEETQDGRA